MKRQGLASKPGKIGEREIKVLRFIESHLLSRGFAPSQREIGQALGLEHVILVQRALANLRAAGKISSKKIAGKTAPRSLVCKEEVTLSRQLVPLLGSVAAGAPIEAIENPEPIEVPGWMLKPGRNYFILRVRGNSMIEDGIFDEDFVLIRKESTAKNGETVVALIDNEATLKRFYQRDKKIILKPANSELHPIVVSGGDFRIAGIYAGVLRRAE